MAMARNLIKLKVSVDGIFKNLNRSIDDFLWSFWKGGHHGPALAIAGPGALEPLQTGQSNGLSLKDLFDGFLWAVPKHRRSKERNRTRRRAIEKRISYNTALNPCETCGNMKQPGYLCGHCLVKIREETKQIQDTMFGELDKEGVIPDKENIVIYEGELLAEADAEKRPVEIKKKRPSWFSRDQTGSGLGLKW